MSVFYFQISNIFKFSKSFFTCRYSDLHLNSAYYSYSTINLPCTGTLTFFVVRGSAVCEREVWTVKDPLLVVGRRLHGFWPFTR